MSYRNKLRFLLLQARQTEDQAKLHEHHCFATQCKLESHQLILHDLLEGPPSRDKIASFDALLIGGAGEYYISKKNLPHFERFAECLREIVELGMPSFGSCYGYQSLIDALGGEVVHDLNNTEVGTFTLIRTNAADNDPLFSLLPAQFHAQMGHKDRATKIPETVTNLASSERCPFQALRVKDKPIWATQFHPELTHITNGERYRAYADIYADPKDSDSHQRILDGLTPSPHSSALLANFVDLVFDKT